MTLHLVHYSSINRFQITKLFGNFYIKSLDCIYFGLSFNNQSSVATNMFLAKPEEEIMWNDINRSSKIMKVLLRCNLIMIINVAKKRKNETIIRKTNKNWKAFSQIEPQYKFLLFYKQSWNFANMHSHTLHRINETVE
jgi:hypothetical protein